MNILYFICGSSGHFVGYSKTTVYHDLQGMKYRHKPVVHSTFMIENNLGRGCTGICWRDEGMGALQVVGSVNGYMSFCHIRRATNTTVISSNARGKTKGVQMQGVL